MIPWLASLMVFERSRVFFLRRKVFLWFPLDAIITDSYIPVSYTHLTLPTIYPV